jgi:hypothetical protein
VIVGLRWLLNLSEFVDGGSESIKRGIHFSETLLSSRDWLKTVRRDTAPQPVLTSYKLL